jgi:hypothetical protein
VTGVTTWRAHSVRWLLVLLVSAGVVVMHSVPMAGGCSAGPRAGSAHSMDHGPEQGVDPDADRGTPCHHTSFGHMCLAVVDPLGVALLLGLLGAALQLVAPAGVTGAPGPAGRPRSPPPDRPLSRPSLTELCISRT